MKTLALLLLCPSLAFASVTTIKSIGHRSGMNDSAVDSATYTVTSSASPVAAFPGAQGSAATTAGGRSGSAQVYVVTSLNGGVGAGTLGQCIAASGPRYCVFAVSGVIDVSASDGYTVSNSNITILGQTAPGKGITITCPTARHGCFNIGQMDGLVMQYLRVRKRSTATSNSGSIVAWHGTNQIFDHVSTSWSPNDAWAMSRGTAINKTTGSWMLIADGMVGHNTASITSFNGSDSMCNASGPIDLHHSILVADHRLPRWGTPTSRLVNNLFYPFYGGTKAANELTGGSYVDIIGNFYRHASVVTRSISLETYQDIVDGFADLGIAKEDAYPTGNSGRPSIYTIGNVGPGVTGGESSTTQYNALAFHSGGVNSDFSKCEYNCPPAHADSAYMRSSPLAALPIPIVADTANSTLESRLWSEAGASRRIDANGAWTSAKDLFDAGVYSRYQAGTLFQPTSENDSRYSGNGWSGTLADINANVNTGKWASTIIPGISDTWVTYWRGLGSGHPTSAMDTAPWGVGYNALDIFASGRCPSNTSLSVASCAAVVTSP